MITQKMREAYDRLARTYDANRALFDMGAVFGNFYAHFPPGAGHLLDLGCGAGEPIPGYFIDKGWRVTGVDFSESMLALARNYQPEMKTIHSDIIGLELDDGQFQAITAIYSLFHIPRKYHGRIFRNMYRWLRPGGKAIFTYASREYTGSEVFSGYIEFMDERLFYSHHSPVALRRLLQQAGFSILSMDYRNIGGETFLWPIVAKPGSEL